MEREYSHLLAWRTYTWVALSSTCMGLLQEPPTFQICSSKMGVSVSVYECPPPPQSTLWMPSTPNSLACAILLLCQPRVGLLVPELSKQPDKEQDAHLHFLQVP